MAFKVGDRVSVRCFLSEKNIYVNLPGTITSYGLYWTVELDENKYVGSGPWYTATDEMQFCKELYYGF